MDANASGTLNAGDTQVFTLTVNSNGTYTFTLLQPLDAPETVAIGASTSFGSGPTGSQVLLNAAGTQQLALLSGWETTSDFNATDFTNWLTTGNFSNVNDTKQKEVNGSTAGWGIDNNNFDGGSVGSREFFRIDFDDFDSFDSFTANPGFDGPPVNFASIELTHFKSNDKVAYVIHYTDGSVQGVELTLTQATTLLSNLGTTGKSIDYIEFMAVAGSGKFDLVDVSTVTSTGTKTLNFTVGITDGDGDTTSGAIAVTVDGSTAVLAGTSGDDVIVGDVSANTLNGGSGNDTLTGGQGSDTFVWKLGETGADKITDFNLAPVASGGDVLDLKDLLVGENANATSLDAYLNFSANGSGQTVITVDANAGAAGGTGQTITLENVQYAALQTYAGGTSDAAILAKLLTDGNLKTDI